MEAQGPRLGPPHSEADLIRHLQYDLCKGKKICVSKALLSAVVPGMSGREVYAKYFEPFSMVDPDNNLSCLRRSKKCERRVRNSLYMPKYPQKEPAHFSASSPHDLNRLASVLDLEIVIYITDSAKKLSAVEVFHDFRSVTLRSTKNPVYFVLTVTKELYQIPWSLDNLFEVKVPFFSDPNNGRTKVEDENEEEASGFPKNCFLKAVAHVMGLQEPDESFSGSLEEIVLANMSSDSDLSSRLFQLWGEKIVIVTYCRMNRVPASSLRLKQLGKKIDPDSHYFATLFVVAPKNCSSMHELDLKNSKRVACVYANNYVCSLSPDCAEAVLDRLYKTNNPDKPNPNSFSNFARPSRVAVAQAAAEKRADSKAAKKAKQKICDCKTCSSEDFYFNMNWSGPISLCSNPLDIRVLLQLLGLDTEDHLNIVEQMCELSVAAFDIESMTVSLDVRGPVEPDGARLPYANIDSAHLEAHLKKVQKPVMISHVDALTFDLPPEKRLTLTAKSDEESSFFDMMKLYWNGVLKSQAACRKKKLKLAEPLLDIAQKYKSAFETACQMWISSLSSCDRDTGVFDEGLAHLIDKIKEDHSPDVIYAAWRQTLPGQLEAGLKRLVQSYNIFSFYG